MRSQNVLFMIVVLTAYNLFPKLSNAQSQCDPVLMPDSAQFVFNGLVNASLSKGNTLYIGGAFTTIGQYTGHFIGVDTVTGKPLHRTTWPQVNGAVNKIIPDGSGGWIIGGGFTQVGATARSYLAQINSSGQVTAWNPNPSASVTSLAISGNTVYVGGAFTTVGGQTRNRIAAIDLTSGNATSWNPNANGIVNAVLLRGTNAYIGGYFTSISGQTRNYLAAIDLTTGNATSWNPAPNAYINCISFHDTTIYAAGNFSSIGGHAYGALASLDTVNGNARPWNPNPGTAQINALAFSNNNTVYVGGAFAYLGSQTRFGLAEVDLSSGDVTAFNPMQSGAFINDILFTGNDLYIGGSFTTVYSSLKNNVARIDIPSGTATSWESDANDVVNTLDTFGSALFVGGSFNVIGYKTRNYAAAIDMNADTLMNWNPPIPYSTGSFAVDCLDTGQGAIYIGGSFWGSGANSLTAADPLTGALIPGFSSSMIYGSIIEHIAYYSGKLYISGEYQYNSSGNPTTYYIGAVNATTGSAVTWNPNPTPQSITGISKILAYNNAIYVCGNFTNIGGQAHSYLCALDPVSAIPTSWNPNADNIVNTFAIDNNTLFAGGGFNNIGGQFAPRLAKVNLTTGLAGAWSPDPDNSVNVIYPYQNLLYIAGQFESMNGTALYFAGIVDTAINTPHTWDPFPSSPSINGFQAYNNKMYVCGGYQQISGTTLYPYFTEYTINTLSDTISISGADTFCAGSAANYLMSTSVIGGNYQWRLNGQNINGATNTTYSYVPANNDHISCTVFAPSGNCYSPDSATSNVITITTLPYLTPTVTATGSTSMCFGASSVYTVTTNIVNGGYQWYVNGNVMNGYTNNTYTYTPNNGDNISCMATAFTGCYNPMSVMSNSLTVTVNPLITPNAAIASSDTTVCQGTGVTYTVTATNITGGIYKWNVNGGYVTGATNTAYTYDPANGDKIDCIIMPPAGTCFSPDTAISDTIQMMVNPTLNPSATLAASSNTVCAGASVTCTATTNVPGGTYSWDVNNNTINGATNATYTFIPNNGDIVLCYIATPSGLCYAYSVVPTNNVQLHVNNNIPATASISTADTVSCGSSGMQFTATTNISFPDDEWYVNSTVVATNTTYLNYIPANGDYVKFVANANFPYCYTPDTVTSNIIHVTVYPQYNPSISISGPSNAATGSTVTVNATVTDAGLNYSINWFKNSSALATTSVPTVSYVKQAGTDNITAVVNDVCGDEATSNNVEIDAGLSVNNLSAQQQIIAYPNPFNNEITVIGLSIGDQLCIYDITGKKVSPNWIVKTDQGKNTFSIFNLSPGSYIMRVTGEKGDAKANISLKKLD